MRSGRGSPGRVEGGRVELDELHVGQDRSGAQGGGDPVAGGQRRVGGVGEQLAGAAAGQHDRAGPDQVGAAVGPEQRPGDPAVVGDEVDQEGALDAADRRGGPHRLGQGALQLGPGGVAAGVDDPRAASGRPPGSGPAAVGQPGRSRSRPLGRAGRRWPGPPPRPASAPPPGRTARPRRPGCRPRARRPSRRPGRARPRSRPGRSGWPSGRARSLVASSTVRPAGTARAADSPATPEPTTRTSTSAAGGRGQSGPGSPGRASGGPTRPGRPAGRAGSAWGSSLLGPGPVRVPAQSALLGFTG